METMVQQSGDFLGTPRLNLEEWAALLRSTCGGNHAVIDPNDFPGWMRRVSVYGVAAAAIKIPCGVLCTVSGRGPVRADTERPYYSTRRGRYWPRRRPWIMAATLTGSSGRPAMFASLTRIGPPGAFRRT
jgi:hypothetical protein